MSELVRQIECMYSNSKCDLHPCRDNSYHSRYMVEESLMTEFPRTLKKVCPQTVLYLSLNLKLKSFALDITGTLIFWFPKTKPDRLNKLDCLVSNTWANFYQSLMCCHKINEFPLEILERCIHP